TVPAPDRAPPEASSSSPRPISVPPAAASKATAPIVTPSATGRRRGGTGALGGRGGTPGSGGGSCGAYGTALVVLGAPPLGTARLPILSECPAGGRSVEDDDSRDRSQRIVVGGDDHGGPRCGDVGEGGDDDVGVHPILAAGRLVGHDHRRDGS